MKIEKSEGTYQRIYVVEGEYLEDSENLADLAEQIQSFLSQVPLKHQLEAQYELTIVQSVWVYIDVYYDVLIGDLA